MALCSRCRSDAAVSLVRRDAESSEPAAIRAFCARCWHGEGKELAALLTAPEWTLEVHDPTLSGMSVGQVEFYLALEELASGADLRALADGLQLRARDTGQPLPLALEGFIRRHRRATV